MKIKCKLSIQDENIHFSIQSVNPENNPKNSKGDQNITYSFEGDTVTYFFNNYEKISTLRLTVEDLLSHLSFSKMINENIQKRVEKKE